MQCEIPNIRLMPMLRMYQETEIHALASMIAAIVLIIAAASDVRTRRVPDRYWAAGAVMLLPLASMDVMSEADVRAAVAYLVGSALLMLYALSPRISGPVAAIPLTVATAMMVIAACSGGPVASLPLFVMFLAMYRMGILAGGADAKCLMLLALSFPYPAPGIAWGLGVLPPVLLTLLFAAVSTVVAVPAVCLARGSNARHPTRYPMRVDAVDTTFEWPVERMEGNQRIWCRPFPDEADAIMEEFRREGATEVMVTPVVPFILPIAAGFIMTAVLGDPFSVLI